MDLTVFEHHDLNDAALRAEWELLSAISPRASLFSTYPWCKCWADTVGRTADPVVLTVQDATGRVVGLFPGCVDRTRSSHWFEQMGREQVCGDHLDLLSTEAIHLDCIKALTRYFDSEQMYDGLVIGELAPDSPTLQSLTNWATDHGFPHHCREHRIVPYTDLPNTFEDYQAGLSSNMRYHIRRRKRDLAKMSGAAVHMASTANDVDWALSSLFRLHELRWQRDGQDGIFQNPEKQDFLRRFCSFGCDRGWARAYVLELAGAIEAVLLAFHWQGTASFYQMGWNPDCAVASPGVVVMAASIEQAIKEGAQRYDFLRGDELYKARWASKHVRQSTLVVACSRKARIGLAAERLKDRIKAAVQGTLGDAQWQRLKRTLAGAAK